MANNYCWFHHTNISVGASSNAQESSNGDGFFRWLDDFLKSDDISMADREQNTAQLLVEGRESMDLEGTLFNITINMKLNDLTEEQGAERLSKAEKRDKLMEQLAALMKQVHSIVTNAQQKPSSDLAPLQQGLFFLNSFAYQMAALEISLRTNSTEG